MKLWAQMIYRHRSQTLGTAARLPVLNLASRFSLYLSGGWMFESILNILLRVYERSDGSQVLYVE